MQCTIIDRASFVPRIFMRHARNRKPQNKSVNSCAPGELPNYRCSEKSEKNRRMLSHICAKHQNGNGITHHNRPSDARHAPNASNHPWRFTTLRRHSAEQVHLDPGKLAAFRECVRRRSPMARVLLCIPVFQLNRSRSYREFSKPLSLGSHLCRNPAVFSVVSSLGWASLLPQR